MLNDVSYKKLYNDNNKCNIFYTYCILKNKNNSFYDEFNFVNRMDKNIFISISIYDINFKNN